VEGKFIVALCAECGRWVHTVAAHPEDFLMPRNEPRRQGRRGKGVPTVATPGSPPDRAGMPGYHPESCQSPVPAIHQYWEYPVGPVYRIRKSQDKNSDPPAGLED